MTANPMGPLSRIGRRLYKDAKAVGLNMRSFNGSPNLHDESGPHHAQAIFTLEDDFVAEPPKDDEWEKFEAEQAAHAAEEREKAAKEGLGDLVAELGERLKNPGQGIL